MQNKRTEAPAALSYAHSYDEEEYPFEIAKQPPIIIGRDEEDLQKYGAKGTLALGKHIVGTGEDAHLTTPVLLDALRPHIIVITGKRGSGKSYTLATIAEELTKLPDNIAKNLCSVIIDTQGIFWTMKTPAEKDYMLLDEWKLKPIGFNAHVYVPQGQAAVFSKANVEFDDSFSFAPYELTAYDWINVFGLDSNKPLGMLLLKVIKNLRPPYILEDIVSAIKSTHGWEEQKPALENMFLSAEEWGIFGESKAPDVLVPGKMSIIDVSLTPESVRALLVALISRKLLQERIIARRKEELADVQLISSVRRTPLPWLMIDEAHNFLPSDSTTAATETLNKIVKEGRQPGITLVLATQRPERLHPEALSQADILLSHRITAKSDIEALKSVMQTYLLFDIAKYINELPKLKGTAILLDDNSERIYKIRVRPRQSWHAGSSPVAI